MSRATIEILLETAAVAIEVGFTVPPPTTAGYVPAGGAAKALLAKRTAADYDFEYTNSPTVQSLHLDTATQPANLAEGGSRWNPTVRTVETALGGGVVLQHGFESLYRAANFTGVTIPNGRVVAFAGVDTVNDVSKAQPMIADGTIPPLYVMGVATEDMADSGQVGRVTYFGEVHDLNTTGATYGETWAAGDILYAHPTIAGGLTKIEPAPPALSIIVASVMKADAIEGALLVRPVLFPRQQYGVFTDTVSQILTAANSPKAVTFNTSEFASGVHLGSTPSRIVCDASGLYNFQFSLQVAKSGSNLANIYIWARVNGVDVPRSNSKISISGNNAALVPSWNFELPMAAGSYFELMWAADSTAVVLEATASPSVGPSIPSAILTVAKVNQ